MPAGFDILRSFANLCSKSFDFSFEPFFSAKGWKCDDRHSVDEQAVLIESVKWVDQRWTVISL